ncbi:TolC family protein [Empedobacter falsenii]|mgnify:FL=1|uniref:TolC family protein n=1 Tax=Empedobacter falsenii TaxID=343874 RepID=A0ABY8V6A9_9FLAO|nr:MULTISPECIES: TolC family protein [Empedobacter]MDM1523939.1 TolC family protein [Empedobacter sp. 225-1]MDM1542615.1 TolC family protein [Empedobacter sp. 189-2]WIH97216.1 TolC family protein [Empedobacter falsenii]HJD86288.1 TolC family protein [Empedobacter falsenii]
MKKIYYTAIPIVLAIQTQAQNITLDNLEAAFLQKNYALIANKFNVDRIDAEIIQEKLWQNPTLSISEVNLWKTYNVEEQPYLFGKYGKNQQISVELEQLIETAGKRKKRVAIKELEKSSALFEYEELLRELKKELRQTYFSLARIQSEKKELQNSVDLFEQMMTQYQRQADLKNVPKADFYRLQTELIGLQKDQIELENQEIEYINKLRLLTQNSDLNVNEIDFSRFNSHSKSIPFNAKQLAKEQNIALKKQENEINLAEKQLILEKAQRTPDLAFQVNYDRGGNIMRDFIGVGVSIDLPIFNTNKGNIKASEILLNQQQITKNALHSELDISIDRLQNQISQLDKALIQWKKLNNQEQLTMIDNYKKHLQNKQITLLEFIDFTQAYRESQQAYFDLLENYQNTFEELNYIVGQDL